MVDLVEEILLEGRMVNYNNIDSPKASFSKEPGIGKQRELLCYIDTVSPHKSSQSP
jgi:hypothetical protein